MKTRVAEVPSLSPTSTLHGPINLGVIGQQIKIFFGGQASGPLEWFS